MFSLYSGEIKDRENLYIEVEGQRYSTFRKTPLHDPTSKLSTKLTILTNFLNSFCSSIIFLKFNNII